MRFRFSRRAEIDLAEIGDYIGRDNPIKAVRFIQQLRTRCRKLIEFPEAAPLRPEFGEDVRLVVFGRYLIFYAVRARLSAI